MSAVEVKINHERRTTIPFEKLNIGDAYVTAKEPYIPCIKTGESTCIYYFEDMWDKTTERDDIEVYPIEAKIEFFGVEEER